MMLRSPGPVAERLPAPFVGAGALLRARISATVWPKKRQMRSNPLSRAATTYEQLVPVLETCGGRLRLD
jgi:hypothetical protein